MARWTPDPSFYPSPRLATEAPEETLGYVALLEPHQTSRVGCTNSVRPFAIGAFAAEIEFVHPTRSTRPFFEFLEAALHEQL